MERRIFFDGVEEEFKRTKEDKVSSVTAESGLVILGSI
jgi:hypothetical protein